MPFCPSCGASVEGKFCPKCGAPVSGSGPAAPFSPSPGAPPPQAGSSGLSNNAAGALAYALGFITGILFLLLEPYNRDREVRFHAFQSIFFSVGLFAIHIVLMILSMIVGSVTLIGAGLFGLLSLLVWLGSVVLWLLLIVKTAGGSKIVLPVIGPLAQKQA